MIKRTEYYSVKKIYDKKNYNLDSSIGIGLS